jgi:transcriptional regulator with XRE-family HTH domain
VKIIELSLDYKEIKKRIETDKSHFKAGKWSELTGVSKNTISNIHGKAGKHNPSLQYIIAVARVTGKPVEWYLYGDKAAPRIHEQTGTYGRQEHPCHFCGDMPDNIKALCKSMKEIVESNHPVIVPALMSNLEAFKYSVKKEQKQDEDLRKLKEKVRHHEKLLSSDQVTGTGRAAGTGMQKKKM